MNRTNDAWNEPRTSRGMIATGLGLGALAMVLMSSRRGREQVAVAGSKARELADRAASASAEGVRHLADKASDLTGQLAEGTRHMRRERSASAAEMLQDLADRANVMAYNLTSRARRLSDEARRAAQRRAGEAAAAARQVSARGRETANEISNEMEWAARRVPGRALLLAAAGIGAVYALQRYGVPDKVRGMVRTQGRGQGTGGMKFVERSIQIDAPMEEVFDTWSNYENFPQFMRNVERVQALDDRRSHWEVKGPAGAKVEFDSVLSEKERPRKLAWGSEPGSSVQTQGRVTLFPRGQGTLAVVQMSYRPPGGSVGQTVASLFGADPKRELQEDLDRMKQFIESRSSPQRGGMSSMTSTALPRAGDRSTASLPATR